MERDKAMMTWYRFYSEAIRDTKLRRIARKVGSTPAEVVGIWCIVLSLASESPRRGTLLLSDGIPVTEDDIADIAGCNVSETLQELRGIGMVTVSGEFMAISNWEKRQFGSDSSTPRVQKHRAKQSGARPKRYGNVTATPPDTDTDTDTDTYTDSTEVIDNIPPFIPPPGGEKNGASPSGLAYLNAQVPEKTRLPLVESLLDIHGLRAMAAEAGSERTLRAVHEEAVKLYRMGYHKAADLVELVSQWSSEDWRGQKGQLPTSEQFLHFASQKKGTVAKKATPGAGIKVTKRKIKHPITGEIEEIEVRS